MIKLHKIGLSYRIVFVIYYYLEPSVLNKPVVELALALLSFKRPTRPPSNCDSTDYSQFSLGYRISQMFLLPELF